MKYKEDSPSGKFVLAWEDQLGFSALKKNPKKPKLNFKASRSSNLKELKMVIKAFEIFFLLLRERTAENVTVKAVKETVPFAIFRVTQTPRKLWGFFPYFLLASHFHLVSCFG